MRYQDASYRTMTTDELLHMEAAMHDEDYLGSRPFLANSLKFEKDHVWFINDHAHKRGRYYRGYRKRRLFELMDLNNLRGKRVLDVGSGNGQHSVFFAMYGAHVEGIDISPEGIRVGQAIAEANGVSSLCNFSVQSISQLSFDDDTFDVVVFNAVLHHVLKYPNVHEETLRVLKPGGRVYFAEGVRSNPFYRSVRNVHRRLTGRTPLGDVDLEYEDLQRFAHGFRDAYIETFCLTLGAKHLIARPIGNGAFVRALLYLLKRTDDGLLRLIPAARRYCSEAVGVFTK